MSLKNHSHLSRFESGNVIMEVHAREDARLIVHDLAIAWAARITFFLGALNRHTDEFVSQIFIGPTDWDVPEFEVGFFADITHQGQGYVTEAVKATLQFTFKHLHAHRIRMECDDNNFRSIRVAERCGMVKEGHIRENKRDNQGNLSGTVLFGLLRQDLEARAHPEN
jgi:aminoglycoside 6'-N-acetyltransferase